MYYVRIVIGAYEFRIFVFYFLFFLIPFCYCVHDCCFVLALDSFVKPHGPLIIGSLFILYRLVQFFFIEIVVVGWVGELAN